MEDVEVAICIAGSVFWLIMQVLLDALFVKTHQIYRTARKAIMVGLIGGPVFVFVTSLAMKLWDDSYTWTKVVVLSSLTGWVFFVALVALHFVAKFRGVLKDEVP